LNDAPCARGMRALIEGVIELAEAEQPDRDRDEGDAADELGRAEREPLLAGFEIDAYRAEGEADERRDQAETPVVADHDDQRDHSHHDQKKEFGRAKLPGDQRDERRDQGDQDDADGATYEGGDGLHDEGGTGSALLRERIAVESRSDGGRFAGRV